MNSPEAYTAMQIPLPPDVLEELFKACQESGLSLEDWVTLAIREKEERELKRTMPAGLIPSWVSAWEKHGRRLPLAISMAAVGLGFCPSQRHHSTPVAPQRMAVHGPVWSSARRPSHAPA